MKVSFTKLANRVRPKDHIGILRPLLPARYSPLQPNGNGLQSVYLTEVPTPLAEVLVGLIGREIAPIALAARDVKPVPADELEFWESKLEQELVNDSSVPETERLAIIHARNGQGLPLRPRDPRHGRQRGSTRGQVQKSPSVGKFHDVPSKFA